MTQPSKGAAAFLFLFGLPFLGAGLFFMYAQIANPANSKYASPIFGVMFGSVFALIGGGLIYAAIGGYGLLKKQAAVEESNPLSPWLWRTDWANRRAESLNKNSRITYWVICILCNLIVLPVVATLIPKLADARDPRVFLPIGFSLIGLILLISAVRATIRHRRFGNTYFEFNSLPFSLGDRIGGRIHLKLEAQAEHGIDLRLSCVRRITTGSGDSRSTNQVVLWQADQNVPSGAVGPGPLGRAIPVDFAIPAESFVTNHDNPSDQVLWLLHAQADVPGVDYSDDFELPVFKSASSAESAHASPSPASSGVDALGFPAASGDTDSSAVAQPAHTKVIVSMHSGGTEFYFRPFRNPGRALALLVFTLIWSGVVYMLYHSHAPLFFSIVFGLFDLILMAGTLHVVFGSARIGVANGEILSRTGILGSGSTRRIPASDVASILPVVSMQQSGNAGNSLYSIRLRMKNGRKLTLADEIDSRQEARWIVSQIETLAGLKLDTRVEFDAPLGLPPQPLSQSSGQVFTKPQPRTSTAASLAMFAMMALAMFGWVMWRPFSGASRANASRAAAASSGKPVSRRVFSPPMTYADVGSLPSDIQNRLKTDFGSWKVQDAETLSEHARKTWAGKKPQQCPGIAVGQFQSVEMTSFAVLLVPVDHPDAGYRFLVFSRKPGQPPYEATIVERSDDHGASNYFIRKAPISEFFSAESKRKFQVQTPEAILMVDSAEQEYEADIYFWSDGRYRNEPVDY